MKKNSIVDWINNGVDFDAGLVPCRKSDCPKRKEGEDRDWSPLSLKRGYYIAISGNAKRGGRISSDLMAIIN